MAAKRFFNESESSNEDQLQAAAAEKRKKPRYSFASVIGEVVMVNSLQNLFSNSLEPLLRRVVKEEVENGLKRCSQLSITRSPSLRIQAAPEPSSLRLIFSKNLSLPIFTGSKIVDIENNPLQVLLVDTSVAGTDRMGLVNFAHPIKIEIVVLDGDFPLGDCDAWTAEEYDSKIVKERTGKRPLLAGEVSITMREGIATIAGDIEFTDNSSWIRSRKFRIGAKVSPGSNHQGARIYEAMTEAFVVKDHRGEVYKKHHPPMLNDEVWRLQKIGKEGAFHKKLQSQGINSVQDFLKLSVVDAPKLRNILGTGMSDKMWDATIKHARTCVLGNKLYLLKGNNLAIFLNPVCQLVKAEIDGQLYHARDLNKTYIENSTRIAYENWSSLQEVEETTTDLVLTQGETIEQYPNHQGLMKSIFHQDAGYNFLAERPVDPQVAYGLGSGSSVHESGYSHDWIINYNTPIENGMIINYGNSESSSDGEVMHPKSFLSDC
ncbi:protein SAR DEFICIENT 1-like [Juglans microcarpa x Juglans regia]|uniref:protein SAR DEFICIENT 1-like n=1 Tax=Juglans microcarpa x Juglans regia TaxID=2249226 RepID=UPI001B7EBA99|nr:protein SAR DEFICIENT 1-like [Juglans microcarpa x Juglans regia]